MCFVHANITCRDIVFAEDNYTERKLEVEKKWKKNKPQQNSELLIPTKYQRQTIHSLLTIPSPCVCSREVKINLLFSVLLRVAAPRGHRYRRISYQFARRMLVNRTRLGRWVRNMILCIYPLTIPVELNPATVYSLSIATFCRFVWFGSCSAGIRLWDSLHASALTHAHEHIAIAAEQR